MVELLNWSHVLVLFGKLLMSTEMSNVWIKNRQAHEVYEISMHRNCTVHYSEGINTHTALHWSQLSSFILQQIVPEYVYDKHTLY